MKRIVAIVLAAVMVLSCNMTAFAEVFVNGDSKGTGTIFYDWGDAHYVSANADGDNLTIVDKVWNYSDSMNIAVLAQNGAEIAVEESVLDEGAGSAIKAESRSKVAVSGEVKKVGSGDYAVHVGTGATVVIGGNVSGDDIYLGNGVVLIEGAFAEGDIEVRNDNGKAYIGELKGTISNGDCTGEPEDKVHYLIGTKDDLSDKLILTGEIISTDTVDGIKKKGYHYTTTADAEKLNGQSFIIKSADSSKKIKIDGTYAGVTMVNNADGTITLTLGSDFKGGIQNLELLFEDIAKRISKSSGGLSKPVFTGTWNNAVSNGNWTQDASGVWHYGTTGTFRNTWGYIVNPYAAAGQNTADWFYFDAYGNMLTGWQFIQGKWYYLNPTKDGTFGACQLGRVTPDGWTVDESGAWIESIPQK